MPASRALKRYSYEAPSWTLNESRSIVDRCIGEPAAQEELVPLPRAGTVGAAPTAESEGHRRKCAALETSESRAEDARATIESAAMSRARGRLQRAHDHQEGSFLPEAAL
jgi:hypothetical protein